MKCEHCLLEWNSPQTIQVLFCPICQKPLINIQKHFNDFESILLYLTTTYGMEILLDKKNTLLFIENYLLLLGFHSLRQVFIYMKNQKISC